MYNLLLPHTNEWSIQTFINKEENWLELRFSDQNRTDYYKYRIHPQGGDTLEMLIEKLKMGLRCSYVPETFYEIKYIYKIRSSLGWKPSPFDFTNLSPNNFKSGA